MDVSNLYTNGPQEEGITVVNNSTILIPSLKETSFRFMAPQWELKCYLNIFMTIRLLCKKYLVLY